MTNVTPSQKMRLYEHFNDVSAIYNAGASELCALDLSEPALKALADKSLKRAGVILSACDRRHIDIITFQDALYPERLNNITNPPWLLYVRGRLPDLDSKPTLAIVGTRKPTVGGRLYAEDFAYGLASRGMIIVSGMAYGIDSCAGRGTLRANSPAVAVLGCGADVIYPNDKEHRRLYSDIVAYGAIVSEYPPGTRPLAFHFPQRNRIISGLSGGVLVIEGDERSGALITARHAVDQNRMVFAIPGRPGDPMSAAPNKLIKNHAKLTDCIDDILSEYPEYQFAAVTRTVASTEQTTGQTTKPRRGRRSPAPAEKKDPLNLDGFSQDERLILTLLEKGRRTVEQIVAQTDMPVASIMSILTMLELKGAIIELPGRIYRRLDIDN